MIADDLSGACDSGAEFLGIYNSVFVTLDWPTDTSHRDPAHLTIVDTESRDVSPPDAALAVEEAIHRLCRPHPHALEDFVTETGSAGNPKAFSPFSVRVLLKKVDSAFRGNYVAELESAIRSFAPRLVVVAPAIPRHGRRMVDGVQLLHDRPIAESFYRGDPRQPVRNSDILLRLSRGLSHPLRHLSLRALRAETVSRQELLSPQPGARPCTIVVVDGETNEDLDRAVRLFLPGAPDSLLHASERVLFVGGQGIARALADHRSFAGTERLDGEGPTPPNRSGNPVRRSSSRRGTLFVCGSLHPASRRQLELLSAETSAPIRMVSPDPSDHDELVEALRQDLRCHGAGILTTPETPGEAPEPLDDALTEVCRGLLRERAIVAVFLTGGNTAVSVCRALGVSRIQLQCVLGPGTVLTHEPLASPKEGKLELCIKGGSLGDPDTMLRYLHGRE